jgi:hypothetical protein
MKITKEQLKQIIKEELEEATKKSPDDIVARFPSSRPGEPDQVIYRWQQDEFDERERALKAFDKRAKGERELDEAHGLSKKDADYVKSVADKTDDKKLKRILKFIVKSNVKVDKTQDVTKMKKKEKE